MNRSDPPIYNFALFRARERGVLTFELRSTRQTMNRAIHPDTLTFVIRELMSMKAECRGCVGGKAQIREVDDLGCNWTVSVLTGWGCGECLVGLLPVIRELKQHFPIADANSDVRTFDLRELIAVDTETRKTNERS